MEGCACCGLKALRRRTAAPFALPPTPLLTLPLLTLSLAVDGGLQSEQRLPVNSLKSEALR